VPYQKAKSPGFTERFRLLRFGAGAPDDPTGFEPLAKTPGKSGFSVLGGANSGAFPPDLQKLMSLWRRLSMAERSAVLAKVRALASGKREVGKAGCEGRLGSRQCPRKTPPASNGELP
jgi:hypothetical protein